VDFWSKRLSDANSVKAVKRGTALRFWVSTANDFMAFDKAVSRELLEVEWMQEPVAVAMAVEEPESVSKSGEKDSLPR
jgi:hypothetical protein